MAWLDEPDPFRRLVMEQVAVASEEWVELHVQNGVASAFQSEDR